MADYASSLQAATQEMGRFVLGQTTLGDVLHRVGELAVTTVDRADVAGITLKDERDQPVTATYTDRSSPEVDEVQYRAGRGPCLDAMRTGEVFRLEDATTEQRWPEFAAALTEHGLRAVLSTPLSVGDATTGALNLYSRSADPFSEEDQAVAGVFAAQASVVLANARDYWGIRRLADQLTEGLASRDLIGQAKGIVMARENCDAATAFEILSRVSQNANRKLVDVAADVVRMRQIRT